MLSVKFNNVPVVFSVLDVFADEVVVGLLDFGVITTDDVDEGSGSVVLFDSVVTVVAVGDVTFVERPTVEFATIVNVVVVVAAVGDVTFVERPAVEFAIIVNVVDLMLEGDGDCVDEDVVSDDEEVGAVVSFVEGAVGAVVLVAVDVEVGSVVVLVVDVVVDSAVLVEEVDEAVVDSVVLVEETVEVVVDLCVVDEVEVEVCVVVDD